MLHAFYSFRIVYQVFSQIFKFKFVAMKISLAYENTCIRCFNEFQTNCQNLSDRLRWIANGHSMSVS